MRDYIFVLSKSNRYCLNISMSNLFLDINNKNLK